MVKTRIQKVFVANSYICRSYRGIGFKFFRIAIMAILCTGKQLFRRQLIKAKLNEKGHACKTKLRNLSCGFIYSRINYGSTEHDIILLTKASASRTQ